MNIKIILSVIFVPIFVSIAFYYLQKSKTKTIKKTTNEQFVVKLPEAVLVIGIIVILMCTSLIIGFTFFSEETPHLIFYIVFGFFLWLGTFLVLKTLKFKLIVTGKEIKVHSIFLKSFIFTFSDIISAVRQVKKNQLKSERLVIKTINGKKIIVESSLVSYNRFYKKIISEVKNECLHGFDFY